MVLQNVFKQQQKLPYMGGTQEGISRGTKVSMVLQGCRVDQSGWGCQLCVLETVLLLMSVSGRSVDDGSKYPAQRDPSQKIQISGTEEIPHQPLQVPEIHADRAGRGEPCQRPSPGWPPVPGMALFKGASRPSKVGKITHVVFC